MGAFQHFRDLGFIEQIEILKAAEQSSDEETFLALTELSRMPVGDDAVDMTVRSTLREVLKNNTELVLPGMDSDVADVFEISLNITAELPVPGVSEKLLKLACDPDHRDHLPTIFRAMAHLKDPKFLDIAKRNAVGKDPMIAGAAIGLLGTYGKKSLRILQDIFHSISAQCDGTECGGALWRLVETIADMELPDGYAFLAKHIHHEEPAVRRLIRDAFLRIGEAAVPFITEKMNNGDDDERLIAADLLGQIGTHSALRALLDALHSGPKSINVAFSIYESLGKIDAPDAAEALLNIIAHEKDEKLIPVALSALDRQVDMGYVVDPERIRDMVSSLPANRRKALLSSLVFTKSLHLFDVFLSDKRLAVEMMESVVASNNTDAAAAFRKQLEGSSMKHREELMGILEFEAEPVLGSILAVDDSPAMRLFYEGIVQELNIGLQTAANGVEGLQTLKDNGPFDAVIVDMNMPEMDGVEMTKNLREVPGLDAVPVIMITTESNAHQGRAAREAGVNSFLVKPFKPEVLKRKLLKILTEAEDAA